MKNKTIKNILNQISDYKYYFLLSWVTDLFFIVIFSLVFLYYQVEIINLIYAVSKSTSENLASIQNATSQGAIAGLLNSQVVITAQMNHLFFLIVIMLVLLYLIWSSFQGINFWLLVMQKKSFLKSIGQFFAYSSVVWLVGALLFYLYLKLMFYGYQSYSGIINVLFGILALVYLFKSFAGYCFLGNKKLTLAGFFRSLISVSTVVKFFALATVWMILAVIFVKLSYISVIFGTVFGLMVMIPMMSISRIVMVAE